VFKLQQDLNSARAGSSTNSAQYVVGKWRLNELHRLARGKNVLVAMIDSEVDQRHPDLTAAIVDRLEPIGREFTPQPHGNRHGRRDCLAPPADGDRTRRPALFAVNAFGSDTEGTYGTTEQILKGIDYAIAKGARVLNMSFAGPRDPLIQLR